MCKYLLPKESSISLLYQSVADLYHYIHLNILQAFYNLDFQNTSQSFWNFKFCKIFLMTKPGNCIFRNMGYSFFF